MSPFPYAAEKFAAARRALMIPHTRGEASSIASALHECSLGLSEIIPDDLDDDARTWVRRIEEFMDTTGIDDPTGRGTLEIKAESLGEKEKFDLSRAIDELAFWFDRQGYEV